MAWNSEFEAAFDPKAVAVVGASLDENAPRPNFVRRLQEMGYQGHLYPVNHKATETTRIHGLKAYPNLVSIPEHIDLVIVSVPKGAVVSVLQDCIAAGAKNIHIYTAGFKENNEREGIEIEERIKEIAGGSGLNVMGPNCMGLYRPEARIGAHDGVSTKPGPVAFLSQSGGLMGEFTGGGKEYGIYFSKAISYGNAAVMDSTDFLEYLATDPETGIITMYIEGVKDGQKLFQQVREINKTKPVIILKGGLTESGSRAVASHTASLAGEEETWAALFKQTGAVRVNSMDELADATMTFLYLPPPKGRRVAFMGGGGGISVYSADTCAREGLEMPPVSPQTRKHLASFITPDGTSIGNPLDIGFHLRDASLLARALEPVAADPAIDAVMYDIALGMIRLPAGKARERMVKYMIDFAKTNVYGKPLLMIIRRTRGEPKLRNEQAELRARLLEGGVPAYYTLERASRAYSRFVSYYEFQRQGAGGF